MRIIAIVNQKGGVAKSTSTLSISAGLANAGRRVLMVDLDPQSSLTYSLGIQAHDLELTIYNLLNKTAKHNDVIIAKNNYGIIPASLEHLADADIEFATVPGREFLLKEALEPLTDYDYILLDCPPSLGLLTLNALTTAAEVFIPVHAEFLSIQGMAKLMETVNLVKKRLNKTLEVTGVFCTKFSNRKTLNREIYNSLKEHFGSKLFTSCIRDNVSIAEASSFGKDIFDYKGDSAGAEDYKGLVDEILAMEVSKNGKG